MSRNLQPTTKHCQKELRLHLYCPDDYKSSATSENRNKSPEPWKCFNMSDKQATVLYNITNQDRNASKTHRAPRKKNCQKQLKSRKQRSFNSSVNEFIRNSVPSKKSFLSTVNFNVSGNTGSVIPIKQIDENAFLVVEKKSNIDHSRTKNFEQMVPTVAQSSFDWMEGFASNTPTIDEESLFVNNVSYFPDFSVERAEDWTQIPSQHDFTKQKLSEDEQTSHELNFEALWRALESTEEKEFLSEECDVAMNLDKPFDMDWEIIHPSITLPPSPSSEEKTDTFHEPDDIQNINEEIDDFVNTCKTENLSDAANFDNVDNISNVGQSEEKENVIGFNKFHTSKPEDASDLRCYGEDRHASKREGASDLRCYGGDQHTSKPDNDEHEGFEDNTAENGCIVTLYDDFHADEKLSSESESNDNEEATNVVTFKRKRRRCKPKDPNRKQKTAAYLRKNISSEIKSLNSLLPYEVCKGMRTPLLTTLTKTTQYIEEQKIKIQNLVKSILAVKRRNDNIEINWPASLLDVLPSINLNHTENTSIMEVENIFNPTDCESIQDCDSEMANKGVDLACDYLKRLIDSEIASQIDHVDLKSNHTNISAEQLLQTRVQSVSAEQSLSALQQQFLNTDHFLATPQTFTSTDYFLSACQQTFRNTDHFSLTPQQSFVNTEQPSSASCQSDQLPSKAQQKFTSTEELIWTAQQTLMNTIQPLNERKKKTKRKIKKKKIKAKPNPFMIYCKFNRPYFHMWYNDLDNLAISRKLADSWEHLDESIKQQWRNLACLEEYPQGVIFSSCADGFHRPPSQNSESSSKYMHQPLVFVPLIPDHAFHSGQI